MSLHSSLGPCRCANDQAGSARLTHKTPSCEYCTQLLRTRASDRVRVAKRKARASMSDNERLQELATSKRRQPAPPPLDGQTVAAVNDVLGNYDTTEARVYKASAELFSRSAMSELVCAVCDCFHPVSRIKNLKVTPGSDFMLAMATRLKPPPDLPANLQQYYDVSAIHPVFSVMMLSKEGIFVSEAQVMLQICMPCRKSLSDKKRVNAPKFAIANGLYMGRLPGEFENSTFTENAMLNLAQPMHFISVVRGGKHASLRSHAYFFRAEPAPPAQILPVDIVSEGIIGVTIVGAMTPMQKAATHKKYDVRVSRLKAQLLWYKNNNRLYSHIDERPGWEAAVTDLSTRVVIADHEVSQNGHQNTESSSEEVVTITRSTDIGDNTPRQHQENDCATRPPLQSDHRGFRNASCESDFLGYTASNLTLEATSSVDQTTGEFPVQLRHQVGAELDRGTWRHNAPVPAHVNVSSEDEICEQAADGLISNFNHADTSEDLQRILERRRVVVLRSSSILSDFDPAFWVNAFGELFPYARGGLDETRPIHISMSEFVRYCLRLSSRRHAQHRSFSMVAFDIMARHSALQAISIKARISPGSMESTAGVSREALQNYVQYQQSRLHAIAHQRPLPDIPVIDGRVRELYANISTGMRAFWGSNEERLSARANLFSMQLELGQPTIFFYDFARQFEYIQNCKPRRSYRRRSPRANGA